jgi:formiminoglutamate deiminase
VTTFHCERAWLGGETAPADVAIEVAGDRITSVMAGVPAPPGSVVLSGVTIPGLANAHSHAFHRALRGRTQRGRGSFWTWREEMYAVARRLDPDSYRALARAVFGEMVLAGITVVGEFHYLHHGPGGVPYSDPNAMGQALVDAAREAGVRLTLLDTCYLHGGIGTPPDATQARFADPGAGAWAERVSALRDAPAVRVGAAVHSVRAVDPASMLVVGEWAAGRGAPLHAHVSEQPAENAACLDRHGRTPTGLLADSGLLGPRFVAVHATHVDAADITRLGESGSTCCLCPTTERDLADGVGPAAALRAAGARLALGSDSQAVIDLFEEARAVELDERLVTGVRGEHGPADLMADATASGYRALGWPDGGRIEPGALADLTSVSLDSVRLAGTRADDAVTSLVFAANATDVHHVVVGGEVFVRDGRHVRLDVVRELSRVLAP